jgi:PIN domain nuclease of toxin-antitoxin system
LSARACATTRSLATTARLRSSRFAVWEIVIRHALGKLRLPLPPAEYIPDRVAALGHRTAAIELRHVLHLAQLPKIGGVRRTRKGYALRRTRKGRVLRALPKNARARQDA